jgi:hypothetical protein
MRGGSRAHHDAGQHRRRRAGDLDQHGRCGRSRHRSCAARLYYARVIEIPTTRWTAYDAFRFDLDLPDEVSMTTQERAYTSPICYTPAG